MKILLSCVNSVVAFIGFDLEAQHGFWYCPSDRLRACGAAYDSDALLVATDNTLTRISATTGIKRITLPGPHPNLAHSVHPIDGMGIGVADTGNSRLLIYGQDMEASVSFEPLEGWGAIPPDAIHLNDFVRTPQGFVASCFNYQPYRTVEVPGYHWQSRGYGLLLSLEKHKGRNVGRVLAGGLHCPHSLVWHNDRLYCCASATGEFVRFAYNAQGMLVEESRTLITKDHFLRGALPLEDGSWILGGSSLRRVDSKGMAVFRLMPDGTIHTMHVASAGEIYDILPWNEAIMRPAGNLMNSLPPVLADPDNVYPEPCVL